MLIRSLKPDESVWKIVGDHLVPILSDKYLYKTVSDIFRAANVPESYAHVLIDSLIEANLTGHDSHGVIRVVEYLDKIRQGRINLQAEPEIVVETSTTLRVDGHWGFGQVVSSWTIDHLICKAAVHHVAVGGVFHCGHIGRAGVYPEMAAERGFVGMAFVNGGGTQPRVAPFGGIRPIFGTNPIAAAIPVMGRSPIVLDFSTSVVASGKIRVARDKGEQLPEGWILDRAGRPSQLPRDYYDGGMLLPAAGHKGSALSLLVEVLGGLLTGAGTPALPGGGYEIGNGVFFLVLNVAAFLPADIFEEQVRELYDVIKATTPTNEDGEVLVPGEIEQQTRARRLAEGIPVPDVTWIAIVEAANSLGVRIP